MVGPERHGRCRVIWWWREGFELTHCRAPTRDDFIVLSAASTACTKSSSYKGLMRAVGRAGVRWEGCYLARHTMITWARRGGADAFWLERVTHNACGTIIDGYTHSDFGSLCRAVGCLDYGPQP